MKKCVTYFITLTLMTIACKTNQKQAETNALNETEQWQVEAIETSAEGKKMQKVEAVAPSDNQISIKLNPSKTYQTITGIGGSFTESSAYVLKKLSPENRQKVLEAYFGDEGARYSLTRTHINSCDFSLSNYSYASVKDDMELEHFTIKEDKEDLIPMILDAKKISTEGFKIIASPWTSPPWMKDNNHWVGGKLLPKYYNTWALFFAKYLEAYKQEGVYIWGVTVENEPHGNGNNWESMHYTPQEMTNFVQHHLGPTLEKKGWSNVKVLGYDQNRAGLKEWVDAMYENEETSRYYDGTAIHWYESTYEVFPDDLQYAYQKAPNKYLIETEGCIDAEVPHWQDDAWYWSKEATDWGWDWASEEEKYLHPKYVPVYRYARDIIGCFNNWVDGWIDWNMVLDRQGGPNWFKNWCIAPVIVDTDNDEVYFTPLYYTMAHFSKYIRPNAKRIDFAHDDKDLQLTAVQNPDGSIVVVLLNMTEETKTININLGSFEKGFNISPRAIQTVQFKPNKPH